MAGSIRSLIRVPLAVITLGGTVRYSPDAPPSVRNIDLDLEPGRRVALVGATGAKAVFPHHGLMP